MRLLQNCLHPGNFLLVVCRRQIELLEEEHCLAEAQRLSQLAEQEGVRVELEQREEQLMQLATEAERKKEQAEAVSAFSSHAN